ncbi:hypothetical protein M413DRAFT_13018 [Hebeloma cylindrosporum]|uniref:FAD-binding PCMH-type domain-containing protein n=1 Tax=Hebeloma cylindrosporum TaxID=76867 RepID=A0A0C3C186_HEBCY|nr:hypothetical protein M413DRAFT_13018 [Hebeloma cylindrosporum h7]
MQNTNFETYLFPNGTIDACYLNVTLNVPCKQESVPPIGVDIRKPEDAQAAINFARRKNLRLVVKNTGHDYLGRSAGRGGFLLWTHHLKDKAYNATFVPQGAPSTQTYEAVTFGAGVQWQEAYDYVDEQGRFIIGGLAQGGSVGAAGGWVMGGGHSAFSPSLGLGVDNVLEFTVVLANGKLVTTNAYQHPDLFWALRGGGGGTYGIVLSATYQTHPNFALTTPTIQVNFTSPEIAQSVVTELFRLHPDLSDAGWGAYTWVFPEAMMAIFVAPNVTVDEANKRFEPLVSHAMNATGGAVIYTAPAFSNFTAWWKESFQGGPPQVGGNVEISSRLLPREMAKERPEEVARIALSLGVATNSVAGGAVSRVDPESTGLNPSWRKAIAQVYIAEIWEEGANSTTILASRERLKQGTDLLDKLTKDSGSYLNEGSLYERDFKKSYFGSHYPKLKKIKDKYDPSSLFVVASGVGSDEWDAELRCRK